ncbi:MAG: ABC transporter substrate-binding protein, partial [Chloroflexota bacterium]
MTTTRRALFRSAAAGGSAASLGVMAACGEGSSAPPTTQSAQPVTVELRHNGVSEAQMARWRPVFDAAKASLPKHITLNATFETEKMWDKLQAQHAGGEGPDVTYNQVNWVITGGVHGIFRSLNDLLARDKVKPDAYNPGAFQSWRWKGQQYAMPYSAIGETVFLYKRLFRELAVPVPNPTWTWADLLAAALKLTKGEGTSKQFGVVLFNNSLQVTQGSWMLNNGGKVFDETRTAALYGDDPKSIG